MEFSHVQAEISFLKFNVLPPQRTSICDQNLADLDCGQIIQIKNEDLKTLIINLDINLEFSYVQADTSFLNFNVLPPQR